MKFKQKKSTKVTLSDKIADALTVKPRADIEDDQIFGTKPQIVSHADFSSDSEDDALTSNVSNRNNLLCNISKKYEGEVVSKEKLEESDSDRYEQSDSNDETNNLSAQKISLSDKQESSEDEVENKQQEPEQKASDSENFSSDEGESDDYSIIKRQKSSDESDQSGDDDEDDEGEDISQLEEPVKEDFEHVKKQNVSEEAKKGACVRNELLIWEGLLEMRIHLQRCMNTANQMPMPDTFQELKQNSEFTEECNVTKANITNVLDKFLSLQQLLLKNHPETKSLSSKESVSIEQKQQPKEDSDEEIPSDTDNEEIPSDTDAEDEVKVESNSSKKSVKKDSTAKKRKLEDYEKEISRSHKAFKPFRDATIQKWNDKTRLATAANIKATPTNTVLQQISYILSDREKLIRRTQLKRTEYDIVGYKKLTKEEENKDQNGSEANPIVKDRKDDDEYIPEIFDDSDFYHQLLRELIECKSADISDPVQLSRQWIALQQMRSKMKRKVDTKATKGRKIKYVVHNPLVNYMAPEKCSKWSDESTNELYSSLFGKMFEHNTIGTNENLNDGFKIKK